MAGAETPRRLGLNQVFPDPTDVDETANKTIDVVAIHGLDTRSPTTWIAWKIDGDPASGDVHWLKDQDMLPSVLPSCRIFTYDWNANIDKDAATQSLLGHADKLLNKLRIERHESGKDRPILFIASCFGGLLLAKALLLASEVFGNYQDIYRSTIGAIFLGTPFQGTHQGFCTAAQLRVAVAVSSGAETTKELLTYLEKEPDERGELDQLVERFCVMINHKEFSIPVVCFYETQETDFTKIIKKLPSKFVKSLNGKKKGILVPKSSACLQGHEQHELSVRHAMLSKFSGPKEDSFETVCYNLRSLVTEAEKRLRERMIILASLSRDTIGLRIANWLKKYRQNRSDMDIEALVLKARTLEGLIDYPKRNPGSILDHIPPSTHSIFRQILQSLINTVDIVADAGAKSGSISNEGVLANSDFGLRVMSDIETNVHDVCEVVQDYILLDPAISLDDALHDNIAAVVEAKPAINLRQHVLGSIGVPSIDELPTDRIQFSTKQLVKPARGRFEFGTITGKQVLVESFSYKPMDDSTDVTPATLKMVKRMVAQLSHPQRTSRHVLPCVGYLKNRHTKQIGVVFEVGKDTDPTHTPVPLKDFYNKERRCPLGLRLRLAHSLAVALDGLHRVGWVHKEFNSMNILFLGDKSHMISTNHRPAGPIGPQMIEPYLFGFEWSRPEDAETDMKSDFSIKNNAYRHPDRWGRPRVKFFKAHDIYSLGVIFLELALWKPILESKLMKSADGRDDPDEIKGQMLKFVKEDAPHMVGQAFAGVIAACLTFEEMTKGYDELSAHQKFKTEILDVLRRLSDANI